MYANETKFPAATVVVQAILKRATDNASGKIRTDKGVFGVWKDKMPAFAVGQRYNIEYCENYRNNVCYRDVRKVEHLGPVVQEQRTQEEQRTQPKRAAAAAAPRAPVRQSAPVHDDAPPAPQSPTDYGLRDDRYWTPKPRHPSDQEHIAVFMGLKCDIEKGRVGDSEDDLVACIDKWRRVYARTFGASQ